MSHSGLGLLASFSNIRKCRQHFGNWISFHPEIKKVRKTWVSFTELLAFLCLDYFSVGIIPTSGFDTCVRFEVLPVVFMVIHVLGYDEVDT